MMTDAIFICAIALIVAVNIVELSLIPGCCPGHGCFAARLWEDRKRCGPRPSSGGNRQE